MLELCRFADFELDGARFELRRGGCAVVLQPKVLRMLMLLIAERERVVSTDELFSALWPGERVGMASIRRAVRGVRQALGESAESQHSVRTVRGFGYQFVLPVHIAPARAATVQATPARIWDDADLPTFRSAETLPLYGRAAELVRAEAFRGWQRSSSQAAE
jgi:DNA-binding winged helix-turn-helix (wHTH) protein